MGRAWFCSAVVMCLVMLPAAGRAQEKPHGPQLPQGWKFTMPEGDPEAGKAAFQKMECYSCHRVPNADLPKERSSGGIGPDLVAGYSKLPAAFLADSIINSHHYISGTIERYRGLDKVSSKMGDYSSIMTVRDLIDIVAFLKHLGPPSSHPEHQ
ncbi:MAG TPA: cytochrome c [Candidatus Margulisiibacteriota bacterium]|nr:cytochrome c [Candidatus Margulisiibacteriota bacterium]